MERPILFNAPMVRAILEGRKTVTRRVIRLQPGSRFIRMTESSCYPGCFAIEGTSMVIRPPCQPGDILWVRETWCESMGQAGKYFYRAYAGPRDEMKEYAHSFNRWHPSIHMPKKAARIFLKVTSVRPERLREMVLADVLMEGVREAGSYEETWALWHYTWDSTIGTGERLLYGWNANPWVWVISFERVDRPEPST